MINVLLIDHNDSFTYLLALYLEEQPGVEVKVVRSSDISNENINSYQAIVLSPGPGLPEDFPDLIPIILKYHTSIPILGVCLGLQAIHIAFGGKLKNLENVKHGSQSQISLSDTNDPLFKGIDLPLLVGRYHSWVCDASNKHDELQITAVDETNEIMAMRHKTYPLFGTQFHPESILTPQGKKIISNFISVAANYQPSI